MLTTNKTFRVFISSTFSDLEAERNALQSLVFPRLSELCRQRGARFQPIDLRWGVSQEAGHEQTTMSICLAEIARCRRLSPRPNFLLLLGERYGWRPLPLEIPTGLFERMLRALRRSGADERRVRVVLDRIYRKDSNARPYLHCLQPRRGQLREYSRWAAVERKILALMQEAAGQLHLNAEERVPFGASATEQETLAGALSVPAARGQAHFFFRSIRGLPQDRRAGSFLDFDEGGRFDNEASERLKNLKKRLVSRCAGDVHGYTVRWLGRGISSKHLEGRDLSASEELLAGPARQQPADAAPNLCRDVYSCLGAVIHRELASWQQQDPLQREIGLHERFRQEWGDAKLFTGRQRVLARIAAYASTATPWPLTVHGASGSGKSALLARAVAEVQRHHPGAAVIFRFLGVTPESSNGRALLESLCREIAAAYGDTHRPVPAAYLDLLRDFSERLKLASREKPLLLFLDALDQLSDQNGAPTLNWLPQVLPDHVRLILSTLPEPHAGLPILRSRYPERSLVELPSLPLKDGEELLELWLKASNRTLQPAQRASLLSRFARCPLPLWLKLAHAEARRWHSYDHATRFPPTVPRLIGNLFQRLGRPAQHGAMLVARSLGFLGAAKNGLTEDELLDLLSRDREFFDDFLRRSQHPLPERRLPAVVWSRLFFDLEAYLTERQGDGTTLLAFFHRQFSEVVRTEFLAAREKPARHAALAQYFARQPHQFSHDGRITLNLRKLSELPYQQREARMWPELEHTLCDLSFIEAKCAAGLIYDLLGDYDTALESPDLPGRSRARLEEFARFVRARSHLLADHPALTFQTALNEPDATAPSQAARRRVASGREERPYLRWINKPQTPSPCLLTCVGHRDLVNSCDVSPDGRLIVSASSDEELKLWDAASGRELRSLPSHRASVETCAFSPNGRQIVSGARDGKVKLWDAATGKETVHVAGHHDAVATCAFSPNGQWIASASYDNTLRIWDARSGRQLHTLPGHKANAVACAFSTAGTRLVSGASDGSIKVWDARTGRELLELDGHDRGVWKCAFSPDDKWIVSSSEDGTLKRWDATSGRLLHTFAGHRGPVWTCAVSPDGRRLASGSKDMTIRLWAVDSGQELACLGGHTEAIWSLAFFPDGRRLVSASWDWSLKVWDTGAAAAKGTARRPIKSEPASSHVVQDGPTIACGCSPDGQIYAAGCSDGSVRLWDAATGLAAGNFPVLTDYVTALGFSPDSRLLMAGGWDGTLKVIDVAARRESAALQRHHDQIRCCTFSRDGTRALSASAEKIQLWKVTPRGLELSRGLPVRKKSLQTCDLSPDGAQIVVGQHDGRLSLWPIGAGRELMLGSHPDLAFCSFSPDGTRLVSSSSDGKIKLWDVRRRRELGTFTGHTGTIESCRFSPDGQRIVSSAWDHTLRIRPLRPRARVLTLVGHTDQLQDGCFTADGKKVLSVGMDGTFRIWDAKTGTPLGLLLRPSNSVCATAFSRNGARLASASHRRALKLWNSAGASEQHELRGHDGDILACAFSPDGRRLVSAASDGLLKLWDTTGGFELATFTGHRGPVATCTFSRDGRTIASGSWDGTVRIWDARAEALPRTLPGHRGWVQLVLFSPDGRRVVSCSQDKTLRIWEVATGRLLRTLAGYRDVVETAAFSPRGQFLVSGCADGTAKVWDTRSGSAMLTCVGHNGAIRAIAFSPDGLHIVSASIDKTLKLWDARSGRLQRTLTGHEGPVLTCAFSRKGSHLLSGSSDQFVKVWNPASGAKLCEWHAGAAVPAAAWHPDGRTIAVGDATGQIHWFVLQ